MLGLHRSNVSVSLNGKLPPILAAMSKVEIIEVSAAYDGRTEPNPSETKLTGSIPPELSGMKNLRRLNLSRNDFSGSIPAELGSISTLTKLDLSENLLTGSIPAELGNLSALTDLILSCDKSNRSNYAGLTGSIPTQIGNLTQAMGYSTHKGLRLDRFNIPTDWIGDLTKLVYLYLDDNSLSGSIPAEIGESDGDADFVSAKQQSERQHPRRDGRYDEAAMVDAAQQQSERQHPRRRQRHCGHKR